jgi:ketosteroid isomerase-like protein
MSQDNVELVRRAFQTFSVEDIDAALSFCSPDVVWYTTDAQDRVVACVDMTGRIKHSEAEVSHRLGFVVSGFRDGTLSEVRAFPSWHDALKAAGLAE